MRARRPQTLFALSALLVAWLGVSFGSLLHLDDHGHRLCAAHGTIEEGSAASAHDAATKPNGEGEGLAGLFADPAAQDADHAECPLATLPSRDAPSSSAPSVADRVECNGVTRIPATLAAHAPLSQLAVAPKASPPAV